MKAQAPAPVVETPLVLFRLGQEEFGVHVTQVVEVLKLENLTRVPHAESDVEGVMNLRGRILTVLDLRRRLGFAERPAGQPARILVVDTREGSPLGVIVDDVLEVMRIPENVIEPPPPYVLTTHSGRYLKGVAKLGNRLIIVCDLETMVAPSEKKASG